MQFPLSRAGRLRILAGTCLYIYQVVHSVFFSRPQRQTSVRHQSPDPRRCFPVWFQIQLLAESRGSVAEDCIRAVCSASVPTKPGAVLDVPGGERDALVFAGLSMTFTSQPCFKAGLQEKECWPRLYPNFPIFCATWASQLCAQVVGWELVQDGQSSGRQGGCHVPACPAEPCGFRRAGLPQPRTVWSHRNAAHLPVTTTQQKLRSTCLTSST